MAAKRIVVDASVARSAGPEHAMHPTSKRCRDFLLCMRDETEHIFVRSPEIRTEWDRHQSGFAREWRASMIAKRRVHAIESTLNDSLRAKVIEAFTVQKEQDAVLKDMHLVEAALLTDKVVSALDEVVRALLTTASAQIGDLKAIGWINPANPDEQSETWLKKARSRKNSGVSAEAAIRVSSSPHCSP